MGVCITLSFLPDFAILCAETLLFSAIQQGEKRMNALKEEQKTILLTAVIMVMFFLGMYAGSKSAAVTTKVADITMARTESTKAFVLGACAGAQLPVKYCTGTVTVYGHAYTFSDGVLLEKGDSCLKDRHTVLALPDVCTGFASDIFPSQGKQPDHTKRDCLVSINH